MSCLIATQLKLSFISILMAKLLAADVCEVEQEFARSGQPCHAKYSLRNEEDSNHGVGWGQLDGNVSLPEYTYRTSDELNSYPFWGNHAVYGGGGYVLEMRGAVREMIAEVRRLHSDGWIDHYTRAVFIELTVYNAQVSSLTQCLKMLHCFTFFFQ